MTYPAHEPLCYIKGVLYNFTAKTLLRVEVVEPYPKPLIGLYARSNGLSAAFRILDRRVVFQIKFF